MPKKHQNLQPWLDYFDLLRSHIEMGYLEVKPDDHEAYITLPALLAMSPTDDPLSALDGVPATITGIRTYAAFLHSAQNAATQEQPDDYFRRTFALHVVKPEQPHDLLYTLLMTKQRSWRHLFIEEDHIELIDYTSDNDHDATEKD